MRTRVLGRTGLIVSEIGFGCWGIGGMVPGASYGKTDDATSLAALNRAVERGITFFDTAEAYGNGHSESLLGEAFGKRDDVVIATKAGHEDFSEPPDFSPAGIRASADRSLKRLKRERIDLLQLHNPTIDILRADPAILETLKDLQRSGKIRTYGVSTKAPAEAAVAIREFGFPVVQVNFNLADQRALETGLFELAAETDTGIIGRTPLAFGFLSGALDANVQFGAGDHRANWSRERIREWVEAGHSFTRSIAERDKQSPALVALRFCLSYPEIGTIIPGMLKPEEVEGNVRASEAGALSSADLDGIQRIYDRSSFASAKIATPSRSKG
jgi:aryl-alcohol dehydrogenase-like predicted oxidoreductase